MESEFWQKAPVFRYPAAGCGADPQMHSKDTEKLNYRTAKSRSVCKNNLDIYTTSQWTHRTRFHVSEYPQENNRQWIQGNMITDKSDELTDGWSHISLSLCEVTVLCNKAGHYFSKCMWTRVSNLAAERITNRQINPIKISNVRVWLALPFLHLKNIF